MSSKLDMHTTFSKNSSYNAIVALSSRQAIGGIVLEKNAPDRIIGGEGGEPLVFLKEISSDGNKQTVLYSLRTSRTDTI